MAQDTFSGPVIGIEWQRDPCGPGFRETISTAAPFVKFIKEIAEATRRTRRRQTRQQSPEAARPD